jgi:predicted Rossmann fold nucleotide-binding protein DprA/Smf involved in DNA uptake
MSQINKEAMKELRKARSETVRAATRRMKEQRKVVKAIKEQLSDHPGTVPEIAQTTELSTSDVLWYLAALKKYGEIVEAEKDGSYFRYQLSS